MNRTIWHGHPTQRVRVTPTQERILSDLTVLRMDTYNTALSWRNRHLGNPEALAEICLLKSRNNAVTQTHPDAARDVVINCLKFNARAYTRFGDKQSTKSQPPKPKAEDSKRSFEIKKGIALGEGFVSVAGLGTFKAYQNDFDFRVPRGNFISITFSEVGGCWYLGVSYASPEPILTELPMGNPVGIDVNLKTNLAVTFDGVAHQTYLQPDLEAALQHMWFCKNRMERRVLGSRRYLEAKKLYNRSRKQVDELRDRYHQKVVNQILGLILPIGERPHAIVIETLDIPAMIATEDYKYSAGYAKVCLGRFRLLLTQQAENQGTRIITADKWYPSTKTCSCCGFKKNPKEMEPGVSTYECSSCGAVMNRDENSATNLWRLAHQETEVVAS